MKTQIHLLMIATAATVGIAANAAVPGPACAPVIKAMAKTLTADHATVTKMAARTMNGLTVGGVNYIQVDGVWKTSPFSPKDNQARSDENLRNAKSYVCESLPDSIIDGVPVANYHARTVTEDGGDDATIAISKVSGLAIQVDNNLGDPNLHYVTRYTYSGIHAPSVQK